MPDAAEDPEEAGGAEGTRPPPPRLRRVLGVAVLVLLFVLAAPVLYVAGRDLSGSRVVGVLALLPPAAVLLVLYRGLFR